MIDFYFSYRSPYSYLILPRMLKLKNEYNLEINFKIVYPIAIRMPEWFDNKNIFFFVYLYKKNNGKWELHNTFENPVPSNVTGTPHKFGYNVTLSDEYVSISSPFYNDGLVYVYSLDSIDSSRLSSKPFHTIDVRKLGDVEGCYAIGPNKFGFGISASFNNNKLLIGSLKEFV